MAAVGADSKSAEHSSRSGGGGGQGAGVGAAAGGSGGGVSAAAAPLHPKRGLPGWNVLVAPSALGDPVTAFDVDLRSGYLMTGTASGVVTAWRIDHLLDLFGASYSHSQAVLSSNYRMCRHLLPAQIQSLHQHQPLLVVLVLLL